MRTKTIGILSIITLLLSVLWLVLLIWSAIEFGPMTTFSKVLSFVIEMDWKFVLSYVNATLITICTTMLFAGFFTLIKSSFPLWATIGIIFIPVYCAFNVIVYLSQITVVPGLLEMRWAGEYGALADILLMQWVQQWGGSVIAFINLTGYAILGLPSIIYGCIFFRGKGLLRYAGLILALNGLACIIAVIGLVLDNKIMSMGTLIGGVLYIVALILFSLAFVGERDWNFLSS